MSDAEPATPEATTTDAGPAPTTEVRIGLWVWLVLGLAFLISGGVIAIRLRDFRPAGKGTASSWDLSDCLVDRALIVQAARPHSIPPLEPRTVSRAEARQIRIGRRGKFLVADDLVVGVAIGGEACAYPIRFLEWHEVVNHTLGGVPIAVTHSPLSGSSLVFDRRPRAADGTPAATPLAFAASGMLFNHNLVLVDGQATPTLWSQLQRRAIAGPGAKTGQRLTLIPASVVRWGDWERMQPKTRIASPEPNRYTLFKRSPYGNYLGSDLLRDEFPIGPLPPPPPTGLQRKTPVLVVRAGSLTRVYPLPLIASRAGAGKTWNTRQGSVPLELTYRGEPATATVRAPGGEPLEAFRSFWFAWYATRPDAATLAE